MIKSWPVCNKMALTLFHRMSVTLLVMTLSHDDAISGFSLIVFHLYHFSIFLVFSYFILM
jgi:hypothetical protein